MSATRPKRGKSEIGWREIIGLPDLGIAELHAKIDTGARTSALNAVIIGELERDGQTCIEFDITFIEDHHIQRFVAPILDRRPITNTSGIPELRYIVETRLALGQRQWNIELSLTDRNPMRYDLILGRTALRGRQICINPGRSFLAGPPAIPDDTASA